MPNTEITGGVAQPATTARQACGSARTFGDRHIAERYRRVLNIYDFVLVRNLNLDVIPGVELLITLLLRIALVEHSVSRTCSASISVSVSQAGHSDSAYFTPKPPSYPESG